MKEALLSMKNNVPSLKSMEVGINSSNSSSSFDIVFIGHFKSKEDLEVFEKKIKFHYRIGQLVDEMKELRVMIDYEI